MRKVRRNQVKRALKSMSLLLAAALALALGGCENIKPTAKAQDRAVASMKPGVYSQTVNGMHEGMVVEVTLSEKRIEKVLVKTQNETAGVSDTALVKMPERIVAAQSIEVDVVAGSSRTSTGILEAVAAAIAAAGGKVEDFKVAPEAPKAVIAKEESAAVSSDLPAKWDLSYDVVVVGGGFAGLSASHSAATHGAKVLLVEKMPFVGGNSQINGGVYASYTSKLAAEYQKKFNLVPDSAEKHIADTLKGGDYMGDPKLVKNMVYGAPFYLDLLLDNGLKVRESLTRPGGHYGYRTYTTVNGVGSDIVQVQKKMVKEAGVKVMTETKMTKIYREAGAAGKVVGIRVDTAEGPKTIKAAKGLVLATGGFSANVEMRQKHVPALDATLPTTNHVGATGEGLVMAQEVGANTTQMSYIQLYPFANPNDGVLDAFAVIPFSGPSAGIVYVDVNGRRYVNEGERRDVCSKAAQDSAGFPTFSVFGEEIYRKGGFITEEQLAAGIKADRIFKADSLEALAAEINKRAYKGKSVAMSGAALAETIAKHNGYVQNLKDPDFGKRIDKGVMMTIEKGPYYAIPQWPSVHHTMGGVTITPKTEVQDVWGKVIPGLYAAGEVTGGVHGTNRLGSNAIPDACVHGYIAGQVAAAGTLPSFIADK
ncbi:MAG: flavocytochrome c [Spirochaetaceae bacterium]|nr:flavocytochrome c [Spirochaetaceae bacterium]